MHCNRVFAAADAVIPSVLIPAQTGNSYVSKCEQKQTISLAVHFALFYNSASTGLHQPGKSPFRRRPLFPLSVTELSVVWVHCFSKEWAEPMWLLPWLPNTGTVTMLPLFFTSFTPADGKILRVVWHCHSGPCGFTKSASCNVSAPPPPKNRITLAIFFFPFELC